MYVFKIDIILYYKFRLYVVKRTGRKFLIVEPVYGFGFIVKFVMCGAVCGFGVLKSAIQDC